jgi:PRC-barrel domain protein
MRPFLISVVFAIAAAVGVAFAEDPAPKPEPGAAHPPTGRVEQVTPTMKAPDGQKMHPPTGRVGDVVPPEKSTDQPGKTAGAALTPSQEWVGRSVFSSDGKDLGKVTAFEQDGAIVVDLGGFLGLGTTRTRIGPDKIQSVTEDRIMLSLTEGDAKNLPAAEEQKPVEK